jgi:hypothetical protein
MLIIFETLVFGTYRRAYQHPQCLAKNNLFQIPAHTRPILFCLKSYSIFNIVYVFVKKHVDFKNDGLIAYNQLLFYNFIGFILNLNEVNPRIQIS